MSKKKYTLPDTDDIDLIVNSIGRWANDTFTECGGYRGDSIVAHLKREVAELEKDTLDMMEIIDCFFLLAHLAYQNIDHYDAPAFSVALRRKFGILLEREWGKPDSEGVIEHVRKDEEK